MNLKVTTEMGSVYHTSQRGTELTWERVHVSERSGRIGLQHGTYTDRPVVGQRWWLLNAIGGLVSTSPVVKIEPLTNHEKRHATESTSSDTDTNS